MVDDLGPQPGDLVVRRNRWILFAHTVGLVVGRQGEDATVWWSGTPSAAPTLLVHIAASLTAVGDYNVEDLRMRCLLAPP